MPVIPPTIVPRLPAALSVGVLSLLVLSVLAACAPATMSGPAAAPARIEALERARARHPEDLALLVDLGAAYRVAQRPEESWPVLERALSVAPRDPAATLQLALTYEAMGEWLDARLLYRNYLEVGRSLEARNGARDRLALLERLILAEDLGNAFEAERPLETAAPDPGRILVLPFAYTGATPDLVPIARVLSEFIARDLVAGGSVTVPDENRIRLLLAQFEPTGDAALYAQDVSLGARVLGAGLLVRGRLLDDGNSAVRLEMEVVNAVTGETIGTLNEREEMQQAMALVPRSSAAILALLEHPPLAAGQASVLPDAPTQSLLWYGRGLLAEDRGDPAAAASAYARAVQQDPRFALARARLVETRAVTAATSTTLEEMSRLATTELPAPLHAVQQVRRLVPTISGGRDATAEVLGTEGIGRELILEIVVQPGES